MPTSNPRRPSERAILRDLFALGCYPNVVLLTEDGLHNRTTDKIQLGNQGILKLLLSFIRHSHNNNYRFLLDENPTRDAVEYVKYIIDHTINVRSPYFGMQHIRSNHIEEDSIRLLAQVISTIYMRFRSNSLSTILKLDKINETGQDYRELKIFLEYLLRKLLYISEEGNIPFKRMVFFTKDTIIEKICSQRERDILVREINTNTEAAIVGDILSGNITQDTRSHMELASKGLIGVSRKNIIFAERYTTPQTEEVLAIQRAGTGGLEDMINQVNNDSLGPIPSPHSHTTHTETNAVREGQEGPREESLRILHSYYISLDGNLHHMEYKIGSKTQLKKRLALLTKKYTRRLGLECNSSPNGVNTYDISREPVSNKHSRASKYDGKVLVKHWRNDNTINYQGKAGRRQSKIKYLIRMEKIYVNNKSRNLNDM